MTGQWTTPDAYAGDVHDPMSQRSYMLNGNNAVSYSDPSGYILQSLEAGMNQALETYAAEAGDTTVANSATTTEGAQSLVAQVVPPEPDPEPRDDNDAKTETSPLETDITARFLMSSSEETYFDAQVTKAANTIRDHLQDDDLKGATLESNGGLTGFDHQKEVREGLRGLAARSTNLLKYVAGHKNMNPIVAARFVESGHRINAVYLAIQARLVQMGANMFNLLGPP